MRAALIGCCVLAVVRSVHLAIADWVASAGTVDALEQAARYEPNDARLLSRLALARNDAGDQSPEVDDELQRVERLNPLDSGALMTLGLREEFRGNQSKAEAYLVRAAEVDHQFKPAWTLANYYARTGQTDKVWPMVQRVLNLEPLGFDPASVFDLCWRESGDDAPRVLGMIPAVGNRRLQYLSYLMATQRLDAALAAWPGALAAAKRDDADDVATLTRFVDSLLSGNRTAGAVMVWNELVGRGMIASARLDPERGNSIADPQFGFPLTGKGFAWRLAETPGISAYVSGGVVSAEISGDEPESFQILWGLAPLDAGRHYRLLWKADGSMLKTPDDPGFAFRIVQGEKRMTECPPMLTSKGCDFESSAGEGMGTARIELNYRRVPGTTRASGTLQLTAVRLELAS